MLAVIALGTLVLATVFPWFGVEAQETAYSEGDSRLFGSFSESGIPGFDLWPVMPGGLFLLIVTAAVAWVSWRNLVRQDLDTESSRNLLVAAAAAVLVFTVWSTGHASSSFDQVVVDNGEYGVKFHMFIGSLAAILGSILTFALGMSIRSKPRVAPSPF